MKESSISFPVMTAFKLEEISNLHSLLVIPVWFKKSSGASLMCGSNNTNEFFVNSKGSFPLNWKFISDTTQIIKVDVVKISAPLLHVTFFKAVLS